MGEECEADNKLPRISSADFWKSAESGGVAA
jgi:hypothetical protein